VAPSLLRSRGAGSRANRSAPSPHATVTGTTRRRAKCVPDAQVYALENEVLARRRRGQSHSSLKDGDVATLAICAWKVFVGPRSHAGVGRGTWRAECCSSATAPERPRTA